MTTAAADPFQQFKAMQREMTRAVKKGGEVKR